MSIAKFLKIVGLALLSQIVKSVLGQCICLSKQYAPVCCDGVEYSNQCIADCEYARNCQNGQCPDEPVKETCMDNIKCSNDQIVACFVDPCQFATCDAPNSTCLSIYCSEGDYRGTPLGPCQALFVDKDTCDVVKECSEGCICPAVVDPVCCGGVTFGNECEAGCIGATNCTKGECEVDFGANLIGAYTLKRISIDGKLRRFPGATATAVFTSSGLNTGSIDGSNGCNMYGGDYTLTGEGEIELGPLFRTKIACSGAKTELELLFAPLIQDVDGFKVNNGRLKLLIGSKVVLVFRKD